MESRALFAVVFLSLAAVLTAPAALARDGDIYLKSNARHVCYVWVNGIYQGWVPPGKWCYVTAIGVDPTNSVPDGHRKERIIGGWDAPAGKPVRVTISADRADRSQGVTISAVLKPPLNATLSPAAVPIVWFGEERAGVRPAKGDIRVGRVRQIRIESKATVCDLPSDRRASALMAATAMIDPIIGTRWLLVRGPLKKGGFFAGVTKGHIREFVTFDSPNSFTICSCKRPDKVYRQFSWSLDDGRVRLEFDSGYAELEGWFTSGQTFSGIAAGRFAPYNWTAILVGEHCRYNPSASTQHYLAPLDWFPACDGI